MDEDHRTENLFSPVCWFRDGALLAFPDVIYIGVPAPDPDFFLFLLQRDEVLHG